MESLATLSFNDNQPESSLDMHEIEDKIKYNQKENNTTVTVSNEFALVEDEKAKVFELLRVLEEFRTKSEEAGNYNEAARTHKQLNILRKQEEKRQIGVIVIRHEAEREKLRAAHQQQLDEFNVAWDQYMSDYESLATQYIQNLKDRHMEDMSTANSEMQETLVIKPPRFSKELIDQRGRQHAAARNHHYREAQQLKRVCDELEETELGFIHEDRGTTLAHRQNKLRKQHQVELQALLARIDGRRAEHVKKRVADSKRLVQRNKNIFAALDSRQTVEAQRLAEEMRKSLQLTCEPALNSTIATLKGVSSGITKYSTSSIVHSDRRRISGGSSSSSTSSSARTTTGPSSSSTGRTSANTGIYRCKVAATTATNRSSIISASASANRTANKVVSSTTTKVLHELPIVPSSSRSEHNKTMKLPCPQVSDPSFFSDTGIYPTFADDI